MADQEKKLSVAQMREILKAKGVKNTSVMRKAELQEQMAALGLLEHQEEKSEETQVSVSDQSESVSTESRKPYVFRGRASKAERQERNNRQERSERQNQSERVEYTERSDKGE